MQITPQSLRDLRVAIELLYAQGRASAAPVWNRIASRVGAPTKTMSLPQHAALQRLRRWDGERKVVNGKTYDYRVSAEEFEITAAIPLSEIEDDNVGAYNAMIEDIGRQIALWPDDLVFDLLLLGETELAFDGLPFFSSSHSLKAGTTIDNLFTSTALTESNLAEIIAAMQSWVGEDGRSLRVSPNLLVVPPALKNQAKKILMGATIATVYGSNTAAAAADNSMRGELELMVAPELSAAAGGSDTAYYVLDTTRSGKPLVFVERKAPTLTIKNEDNDDAVFWDNRVVMGARARGVAGFGSFFLAAKGAA